MAANTYLYFDDFTPGEVREYGAYAVTREEIVGFATEFDPQPFHLDEQAGKASLLGGLAASGWHNCAMLMRMNCDSFLVPSACLGAPGIAEVRWVKPVHPGDMLRARHTVIGARPSRSRPDMGLVDCHFEVLDRHGATVMIQRNLVMFGRRGATRPPEPGSSDRSSEQPLEPAAESPAPPE